MRWIESWRADPAGRPLADRHYNRQTPGAKQYAPTGRAFVLRTPRADALWITSWPFAEYTKHEWAGAWVNSLFRNESRALSSELIREAVAATRWFYGEPPPLGMVTFVDPRRVPGFFRRGPLGTTLEWGYSYWQAGFTHVGWTKENGLYGDAAAPRGHAATGAASREAAGPFRDCEDSMMSAPAGTQGGEK